jgi:hypothetical protein
MLASQLRKRVLQNLDISDIVDDGGAKDRKKELKKLDDQGDCGT